MSTQRFGTDHRQRPQTRLEACSTLGIIKSTSHKHALASFGSTKQSPSRLSSVSTNAPSVHPFPPPRPNRLRNVPFHLPYPLHTLLHPP